MAMTTPPAGGRVFEEFSSSLAYLVGTVGHSMMQSLREASIDHGLKPRQVQALDLLADRGAIGQRELGDLMHVDHSILVTLLNPLEAEGLIERTRSSQDRRRHVVTITPSGKRRLARAARALRESDDALFGALSSEQRAQLRSLLLSVRGAGGATTGPEDDC